MKEDQRDGMWMKCMNLDGGLDQTNKIAKKDLLGTIWKIRLSSGGYTRELHNVKFSSFDSCIWISLLLENSYWGMCMHAKSLQSCLTLCDPMDYSLPGSSVHGILQARILEWIAISFSRGCSWPRDWTWVSCIAGGFFTTESHGKPNTSSCHLATTGGSQ